MFGVKKGSEEDSKKEKKQKSIEIELETMKDFLSGKKERRRMKITDTGFEEEKDLEEEKEKAQKKEEVQKKEQKKEESPFLADKVSELPDFDKKELDKSFINKESSEKVPEVNLFEKSEAVSQDEILKEVISRKESQKDPGKKPSESADQEKDKDPQDVNNGLLIVAIIIFLGTLVVGGYYYFYVLNGQKEDSEFVSKPPLPDDYEVEEEKTEQIETSEEVPVELVGPTETQVSVELEDASKGSFASPLIFDFNKLDQTSFIDQLKAFLDKLKADDFESDFLSEGVFVKISQSGEGDSVQQSNTNPSSQGEDLMAGFGITIPGIADLLAGDNYLFVLKETVNTDDGLEELMRLSLFMQLSPETHGIELDEFMKSNETSLPVHFANLFIDGEKPKVTGQVTFSQSDLEPRGRYYNYVAGETNKSVDWVVLEHQEKRFLMVSTSMNSTAGIVDRLVK